MPRKPKKKKDTFREGYDIRYNHQLEDGYWECGCIKSVYVNVEHGVNEKNNHEAARQKFLKRWPDAEVTCVFYH